MIWEYWLETIADIMSVTSTEAGIIMSLFVTVSAVFLMLIVMRFENYGVVVPVTALLSILVFIYMGWFPAWAGSVIALILAYLVTRTFFR